MLIPDRVFAPGLAMVVSRVWQRRSRTPRPSGTWPSPRTLPQASPGRLARGCHQVSRSHGQSYEREMETAPQVDPSRRISKCSLAPPKARAPPARRLGSHTVDEGVVRCPRPAARRRRRADVLRLPREGADPRVHGRLRARSAAGMSPEEAWEALRPLTRLGQALAELETEVDVPEDVPLLGIQAGRYDVQRLIYWHVAKLFWNARMTFEENNHLNFDWYAPALRAPPDGGGGARLVRRRGPRDHALRRRRGGLHGSRGQASADVSPRACDRSRRAARRPLRRVHARARTRGRAAELAPAASGRGRAPQLVVERVGSRVHDRASAPTRGDTARTAGLR